MKARNLFLYLPLVAALTLTACGSDDDDVIGGGTTGGATTANNTNANIPTVGVPAEVTRMEFPKVKGGASTVVVYRANSSTYNPDGVNFCVEWDCDKKAQRWTCYTLTNSNRKTGTKMVNGKQTNITRWYGDTRADQTGSEAQYFFDITNLTLEDFYYNNYSGVKKDIYSGSGFDHGHICPSQDRLYTEEANKQTFYLTNMQPQYSVFNGSSKEHQYKGLWLTMENFVHKFSLADTDTLFVCKGGTIDSEDKILKRIDGKMIVPKYFYAALLLKTSTGYRAMGLWFEHTNVYHGDDSLADYVVNIDELERLTGIDFFCNLPDDVENHIEALPTDNVKRLWGFK